MSFYRPLFWIGAVVRTIFKVLLADAVLVGAMLWVFGDLQWRAAYAASQHSACPAGCGYSPSFSYTFLTQFFTMSGGSVSLTSPPTLDWIQLIFYTILVVNGWLAYKAWKSRRLGPATATPPQAS